MVRVEVGALVVSHSNANSGKNSATNAARDGCWGARVRLGANIASGVEMNERTASDCAPCVVCMRPSPSCWRTCSDAFNCNTCASVSANALLWPIDATCTVTVNVRRGCRFAKVAILSAHIKLAQLNKSAIPYVQIVVYGYKNKCKHNEQLYRKTNRNLI